MFVYNSPSIALVDLVVMCGFLFVFNFFEEAVPTDIQYNWEPSQTAHWPSIV